MPFVDEVQAAFGFLEPLGFHSTQMDTLSGYAGGERVTLQSDQVRLDIVLDHRGELDAALTLLEEPDRSYPLASFMPSRRASIFAARVVPSVPRPPFMFGGGTTRPQAVDLLAECAKSHALDALRGDPAAFRRAREGEAPG